MWCYWEHVAEHIGNLMETHPEVDRKTLKTTKIRHTHYYATLPPQKGINWVPWGASWLTSLAIENFYAHCLEMISFLALALVHAII